MKKQNQKKNKRKLLLSIFIPVGVAALTAGIVTPCVIASNKNILPLFLKLRT